jgi:effector-binding domain-containing protein
MKALKYIGLLLLTLLALFLILGIVSPKKTHVERTTTIQAPVQTVQDIVSKFSTQKDWNPWQEYDPNMETTTEGIDGAVGSKYSWSGNKDVGKGYQTVTRIEPGYVETELVFTEPWEAKAVTGMKLSPADGGTQAIWSFDSESPFPWNALNLFMNMDKMLGPDFEKGLAKLKAHAELVTNKKYRGYSVQELNEESKFYVGTRKLVQIQDITPYLGDQFGKVGIALAKAKLEMDGAPAGLYYTFDEKAGTTEMVAGMPIKSNVKVPGFTTFEIPAGMRVVIDYYGAYEKAGEAHYAIDDYIKEKGLKSLMPAIEVFVTDPVMEKDTAKWLTRIIYPVAK